MRERQEVEIQAVRGHLLGPTKQRGGSAVVLHPQPIFLQMQQGEHLCWLS